MFGKQLGVGKQYTTLTPVISILFADFVAIPELTDYHTCWMWTEVEHGTILSDYGQIHIIEFPKYEVSWEQANDPLEQWVVFFNEVNHMLEVPLPDWAPESLREAYRELEKLSKKPELRDRYEYELDKVRFYHTQLAVHYEDGLKEGLEKGREEGREEGRLQVAQAMLANGVDPDLIALSTGFSLEELKSFEHIDE